MRSLAENEGIADKSMFSGSPRYSAVFIVIDNGEVPERITEMSGRGSKALVSEARKEETEAV